MEGLRNTGQAFVLRREKELGLPIELKKTQAGDVWKCTDRLSTTASLTILTTPNDGPYIFGDSGTQKSQPDRFGVLLGLAAKGIIYSAPAAQPSHFRFWHEKKVPRKKKKQEELRQ